jgi:hypothetical protein
MPCACASASAWRALHVRFGPKATEMMRRNEMLLCANRRLVRRSKQHPDSITSSFQAHVSAYGIKPA